MKNAFFLLIIGMLVLIACEPKKSDAPAQSTDTVHKQYSTEDIFEKSIVSGRSTADTAETEIIRFLEHANLQEWGRKWALGGEFESIGDFFPRYETDTDKGTLMWFIHDNVSGEPRVILACEGWHKDDRDEYPRSPILTIPDKIFTFGGAASDFKLEDHPSLITRPGGRSILREQADQGTRNYEANVMPRLYWRSAEPFNKSHGAFFQNNLEIDSVTGKPVDTFGLLTRFVNQKGARGMRYYFALDTTQEHNKIRIFLIATDSAGNNLLRADQLKMDEPPIIIQKSIPPGQDRKEVGKTR